MIYADVLSRLERDEVRYVVVGGVAIQLHGFERETCDLDIVVDAAPAEAERATRSLVSAGFTPTLPLPLAMLTVLTFLDRAQRGVDVFARYHVSFAELWANSEQINSDGCAVRVASLADIIRAKQLTKQTHHLRDAEWLLAQLKLHAPARD
jgi:hypothetical protein